MFAGLAAARPITWDLESLIQEIMMALVGYTGDVFVDSNNKDPSCTEVQHPERCTISLAPDIVLAEDVNKEELLRLVQLSFHYKQIKQFIQQEQQPAVGHKSKYRCALCTGIDEVLCLYEDEVVLLQDRLLQGGLGKGLPGITYELADLQRLLVHVHYMVYQLRRRTPLTLAEEEAAAAAAGAAGSSSTAAGPPGYDHTYPGLGVLDGTESVSADDLGGTAGVQTQGLVVRAQYYGARLLHWLHERKAHGDQLMRACTQRLMWHVNQVFFNQLTLWMVHGLLTDSSSTNEFLIKPSADSANGTGEAAAAAAAAAGEADTDAVRDASRSSSSRGAKPSGPPTDSMDTAVMSEGDTYRDFHSAFVVDNLQLPPGLSTHTASSIEFVGRAVRLLKSAPAAAKLREMQDAWGSYSQQQQQQGGLMGLGGVGASLPQQLLPYGDAMAYAAALRLLQDQAEYSPGALERTVEAIRADVASRVWQLVVVDSRLTDHLSALKDYMLLGKGDFYQCFLTDAARALTLPGVKDKTPGLELPWQSAANKSSAADDPHFANFSIVVNTAEAEALQAALQAEARKKAATSSVIVRLDDGPPDVADCLRVKAHLPWPLGVLITEDHLTCYNRLFALLLKVKRVQLDLEAAWQELGRLCGRQGGNTQPRGIGELLQLRQQLGHLIGNLQVYFHLDVIETHFDALLHKVAAAQDFAEVAAAHEAFVRTLIAQTLLLHAAMVLHMYQLFALSRRLCALVKATKDRRQGVDLEAVMALKREFEPVVQSLVVALRSKHLKQQDKAPYLTQLSERLTFNGYYGKGLLPGAKIGHGS